MIKQEILIKPLLTEKSNILRDKSNQVIFEVHKDANKIEVKRAVETAFSVKVKQVRILNRRGKERRLMRFIGRRPAVKRAIVTLQEGEKIGLFEGA